jgi:hypothetical protein
VDRRGGAARVARDPDGPGAHVGRAVEHHEVFRDWHLARIYQGLSARFHLAEWHKTVDEKLKTLDDIYQILQQDRNSRWMFVLEAAIVLLFVIDILYIVFAQGK